MLTAKIIGPLQGHCRIGVDGAVTTEYVGQRIGSVQVQSTHYINITATQGIGGGQIDRCQRGYQGVGCGCQATVGRAQSQGTAVDVQGSRTGQATHRGGGASPVQVQRTAGDINHPGVSQQPAIGEDTGTDVDRTLVIQRFYRLVKRVAIKRTGTCNRQQQGFTEAIVAPKLYGTALYCGTALVEVVAIGYRQRTLGRIKNDATNPSQQGG
ncbi:hypothetical protein SRDD_44810 [Serratia sp. DD3]|nr:hypothetical protein SRDD_44810 [Serratia sp. DD3]